jgi:hypothetical protein
MTIQYRDTLKNPLGKINPVIEKYANMNGFKDVRIVYNWKEIVGAEIEAMFFPSKIITKKLENKRVLYVTPLNMSVLQYFNYYKKLMQDRVNKFLGYNFISEVQLSRKNNI